MCLVRKKACKRVVFCLRFLWKHKQSLFPVLRGFEGVLVDGVLLPPSGGQRRDSTA